MLNRQVGNKVKEFELMGKKYEKVDSLFLKPNHALSVKYTHIHI
jgi:hypothetical protein